MDTLGSSVYISFVDMQHIMEGCWYCVLCSFIFLVFFFAASYIGLTIMILCHQQHSPVTQLKWYQAFIR